MDKAVNGLLSFIREEGKYFNPPELGIGIVQSQSPLTISYSDILFDRSEMKISEHLTERTVDIELISSVSEVSNITNAIKQMKLPMTLKVHDRVVAYLKGDTLLVLCKVV